MPAQHEAQPFLPSPTKKWHNANYPAIDATRPELSLKGKSIVVTGGGTGIGRETAKAFAAAGATSIFLFGGRRESPLAETKDLVASSYSHVEVNYMPVDVSNSEDVKAAADRIGSWDVLVLNAGYSPACSTLMEADIDEWCRGWDVNMKGTALVCQALLPKRNANASVISTNTAIWSTPASIYIGLNAYAASKMGLAKMIECFAAEVPDCHFVSMCPGTIETDILVNSGFQHENVPKDDVSLPANFAVWLASEEARFLRGKVVWAQWDVDELKARAEEIRTSDLLTTNVTGWPFGWEGPAFSANDLKKGT